jgi:hypothetical protein
MSIVKLDFMEEGKTRTYWKAHVNGKLKNLGNVGLMLLSYKDEGGRKRAERARWVEYWYIDPGVELVRVSEAKVGGARTRCLEPVSTDSVVISPQEKENLRTLLGSLAGIC